MNDHTFAICAYKESEYLEECIKSLKNQTVSTNIILATSTPNDYISGLCSKYNIEMFVNNGEHGITQDWNFAYAKADSKYVTIAHQDDVYEPEYVENLLSYIQKVDKPIIFFTDYGELRDGKKVYDNELLKIDCLRAGAYRSLLVLSDNLAGCKGNQCCAAESIRSKADKRGRRQQPA